MAIPLKKIALHTATAGILLEAALTPIFSDTAQSIHQMVFDAPQMYPTEVIVRVAEYAVMLGCNYLAMPDAWRHIPGRLRHGPDYWNHIDEE